MGSKTRIYQVETFDVKAYWHLVEATSQAAATKHVAAKCVARASLPNGKRIAELMSIGVKVEEAAAK